MIFIELILLKYTNTKVSTIANQFTAFL